MSVDVFWDLGSAFWELGPVDMEAIVVWLSQVEARVQEGGMRRAPGHASFGPFWPPTLRFNTYNGIEQSFISQWTKLVRFCTQ